jgi:hypothetical protein
LLINIPSAPGVTTVLVVPSVYGVPAVIDIPSGFSIYAAMWHSAVDTGGKFAAVVVDTGGERKSSERCLNPCYLSKYLRIHNTAGEANNSGSMSGTQGVTGTDFFFYTKKFLRYFPKIYDICRWWRTGTSSLPSASWSLSSPHPTIAASLTTQVSSCAKIADPHPGGSRSISCGSGTIYIGSGSGFGSYFISHSASRYSDLTLKGTGTRFLISQFLITKFLTHKAPNPDFPNHKSPKLQNSYRIISSPK